ncbi:MAG: hypothetical protein WC992_07635, partial [Acholeplasmataceae bacterium]
RFRGGDGADGEDGADGADAGEWVEVAFSYMVDRTITLSDTSLVKVGLPVRLTNDESDVGYGIVTAVEANTSFTYQGWDAQPGLVELTKVEVGPPWRVVTREAFVPGTFEAAGTTTDLLARELNESRVWLQGRAFPVQFLAKAGTLPDANLKLYLGINGSNVFTPNGIQITNLTSGWCECANPVTDGTQPAIAYGDSYEIRLGSVEGDQIAEDLSVALAFVLE